VAAEPLLLRRRRAMARFLKLRRSVARINPLVEQLPRVARLDAVALDVSKTVDLNVIAASAVAMKGHVTASGGAPTRGRGAQ